MPGLAQIVVFNASHPTAGVRVVTPLNRNIVFEWQKESDFNLYVKRLRTKLEFKGDDFDWFLGIEEDLDRCLPVELTISVYNNESYINYFFGLIKMNNGVWDISRCRVTFDVEADLNINCLKRQWEREYNLFDIVPAIDRETVNSLVGDFEITACQNTNANPVADEEYQTDCLPTPGNPAADGYVLYSHQQWFDEGLAQWIVDTGWIREKKASVAQPIGNGWIDIGGGQWARLPFNVLNEGASENDFAGTYYFPYFIFAYVDGYHTGAETYDNGMLLSDALAGLMETSLDGATCEGITLVSNFFGINPDATEPTNDAYTSAAANLQNVVIWQKSDVTNPGASNNATKAYISFKKLIENLKARFNLDISLDGNTLRLEHVSYFDAVVGIDLSADPNLRGTKKYSYDTQKMPYQEETKSMDDKEREDFFGVPILYGDCGNDDVTSVIQSDRITTDLYGIALEPSGFSLEGFFMANCVVSGGNYYFDREIGELSGDWQMNGHLAWANLQEHYYKWGRPFFQGTLNNAATSFETWLPSKSCEFETVLPCPSAFDFDPSNLIQGVLGYGEITSATLEFPSYKFDVKMKV